MRGFTSVVRLPLFLIVVFTISAAAQEQPENNQFNGLDYTLQKPAKNERYAKKKFGDHLFISGEAGLILDRSAGSLFATPGLGLRAGLTVGDWFSPVQTCPRAPPSMQFIVYGYRMKTRTQYPRHLEQPARIISTEQSMEIKQIIELQAERRLIIQFVGLQITHQSR